MWDRQYQNDMDVIAASQNSRRLVRLSTCPACLLEWQTEGRRGRDFNGVIVCPECLHASVPSRGGRRLVQPERVGEGPARQTVSDRGR